MIDFVIESFKKGGLVLLPIYLASVWAWILIILSFFRLYSSSLSSRYVKIFTEHPDEIDKWLNSKQSQKKSKTLIFNILSKLKNLPPKTEKDFFENIVDEIMKWKLPVLEKDIDLIGILAGMTPLLGLLGTVTGMITTFKIIGAYGTSNPALMADSISEALTTTQNGLITAFPLMVIHIFLYNYQVKIEEDANEIAVIYINHHDKERKKK